MKRFTLICMLGILPGSCMAQLTVQQKVSDFRVLVGHYDKYYAPYEWKKQLFNFDALLISPWLDRVAKTTSDLDFYELCVEYVASLNDTHDSFGIPSDFVARLGFTTDLYDNKLLVDSINRTLVPLAQYPIVFGDELVSIDGVLVEQFDRGELERPDRHRAQQRARDSAHQPDRSRRLHRIHRRCRGPGRLLKFGVLALYHLLLVPRRRLDDRGGNHTRDRDRARDTHLHRCGRG